LNRDQFRDDLAEARFHDRSTDRRRVPRTLGDGHYLWTADCGCGRGQGRGLLNHFTDELKRRALAVFFAIALISLPTYMPGNSAQKWVRGVPDVSQDVIVLHHRRRSARTRKPARRRECRVGSSARPGSRTRRWPWSRSLWWLRPATWVTPLAIERRGSPQTIRVRNPRAGGCPIRCRAASAPRTP